MLLVISPAKTLDFDNPPVTEHYSQPDYIRQSKILIDSLREMAPQEISKLMKISDKLGVLNFDRYQQWRPKFSPSNSKQALLAFRGDVYTGLDADTFSEADFDYAQEHLRILSGLYGLLKPLDLIRPYRLEMGTKLKTRHGSNLYQFWGDALTEGLNAQLAASKSSLLLNLASEEYFKAVKPNLLNASVISPVFKDLQKGRAGGPPVYKIVSFYAKKARGMMAAYVIRNRIEQLEELRNFAEGGYRYNPRLSKARAPVFTRDEPL